MTYLLGAVVIFWLGGLALSLPFAKSRNEGDDLARQIIQGILIATALVLTVLYGIGVLWTHRFL